MFALFVAMFVALGAVAYQAPPRQFYPVVEGMKPEDRAACNAAADAAVAGAESSPGASLLAQVGAEADAFAACAKKRGYTVK